MKVPHVRDMYEDGNPGWPMRWKTGMSPSDLGQMILAIAVVICAIRFIVHLILWL